MLVTGKGGVGRSTMSSALAIAGQRCGKRVLLTEIVEEGDDYSPLARHFQRDRLPPSPGELMPGLRGVALMPRTGQEMFLSQALHSHTLVRAALASETIRRLLAAGPSFREMGIYFQLLTYLRASQHDGSPEFELTIVDMPATGHTLSLTGLPDILLKLIPRGPIADELREGVAFLNDPEKAVAWIVTLPEMLPVSECLELLDGLEKTRVPVGGILVNRVPSDPFAPAERAALQSLVARPGVYGVEGFNRVDLAARAMKRLREATAHLIFAVEEADVPASDLVAWVAERIERGEPLPQKAHAHPESESMDRAPVARVAP